MTESDLSGHQKERKIVRVMRTYDLDHLEVQLVNRWTGTGEEQFTIRELARWFNVRVVERAMEEHGVSFDGLVPDPETVYDAIDADDPDEHQESVLEALRDSGFPVDDLAEDLPHWRSVYAWLTEDKEVEGGNTREPLTPQRGQERIDKLLSRVERVSDSTLSQLAQNRDGEVPDAEVSVRLRVKCSECEHTCVHREWIQAGGCPSCTDSSWDSSSGDSNPDS